MTEAELMYEVMHVLSRPVAPVIWRAAASPSESLMTAVSDIASAPKSSAALATCRAAAAFVVATARRRLSFGGYVAASALPLPSPRFGWRLSS